MTKGPEIKRYYYDETNGELREDFDGEFVRYSDHEADSAADKAEIARLREALEQIETILSESQYNGSVWKIARKALHTKTDEAREDEV